jgi:ADP-heptose:LPS heptosyltransferase
MKQYEHPEQRYADKNYINPITKSKYNPPIQKNRIPRITEVCDSASALEGVLESLLYFDHTRALRLSKEILEVYSLSVKNSEQAFILAKLYADIKEYELAASALEYCIELSNQEGNTEKDPTNEKNLSFDAQIRVFEMYLKIGDIQNAISALEKTEMMYEAIKERGFYHKDAELNMGFNRAYLKYLQHDYEYCRKYYSSLLNEENIKKLNEDQLKKVYQNLAPFVMEEDFISGLEMYFNSCDGWQKDFGPFEKWNGEIIPEANIIVYVEGGIGDHIMNLRFIQEIKQKGMNPIWLEPTLFGSKSKNTKDFYIDNGIEVAEDWIQIDKLRNTNSYMVHLVELPIILDLNLNDLWKGSYIKSSNKHNEIWAKKIKYNSKLNIGIKWKGNAEFELKSTRNLPLKMLYDNLKHIDANFYCLEIEDYEQEIKDFPKMNVLEKIDTMQDTCAIVDQMDIIITACTGIGHMSAAMDKPTYFLIPSEVYYVWVNNDGLSCPWYGSNTKVIGQKEFNKWENSCATLKNELFKDFNI